MVNHGWEDRRVMNRWPTVPVAPRTPTDIGPVGCCIDVRWSLDILDDEDEDRADIFYIINFGQVVK